MTSIYLVRHAQAQGNEERRFQGNVDLPLTLLGRVQIKFVSNRFQGLPIHHVYSSPLKRALDTAKAIAASHGFTPTIDPRLTEIHGGSMENCLLDDLQEKFPTQFAYFLEQPHLFKPIGGGESYYDVYERMAEFLSEVVERHAEQTIVLVSHGCALRCLLCSALSIPLERMNDIPFMQNTGVTHLIYTGGGIPRAPYIGDVSHLPDDKIT